MREAGRTTTCMGLEPIHGKMVGSMKASITWIKNMDSEFIPGLMVGGMKVTGQMESSMEKESISFQMVLSRLESGRKARGLDGSIRSPQTVKKRVVMMTTKLINLRQE